MDDDLGDDKPHEPTILAFSFNGLDRVLTEDGLAEGGEVTII